ncbi:Uncharacterized protein PBTT_01204 [Plasmodiophora brassicae]|uniref:Uncharacterized protein n=1 Tax=Plasmodiophora brassicae TaxID=37360 RepID=A0A0G4IZH5_PLABS|nr:hypothetical protein PBRA_001593 [Plasmodiophora brassicae]
MTSCCGGAWVLAVAVLCYAVHAATTTLDYDDVASKEVVKRHLMRSVAGKAAALGSAVSGGTLAVASGNMATSNDAESLLSSAGFATGGGMVLAGLAANIYSNAQLHLAVGESAAHSLTKESKSKRRLNPHARSALKFATAAVSSMTLSTIRRSPPATTAFLLAGSAYYGIMSALFDP